MEESRVRPVDHNEKVLAEGWIKCPFCPCWFVSSRDFELHMNAFGEDREVHLKEHLRQSNFPSRSYSEKQRDSWERLHEKSRLMHEKALWIKKNHP